MTNKPTKTPTKAELEARLKKLKLGKMYRIDTYNPESSRTTLRNLAIDADLRSVIKCEVDHVLIILWNDKMFER